MRSWKSNGMEDNDEHNTCYLKNKVKGQVYRPNQISGAQCSSMMCNEDSPHCKMWSWKSNGMEDTDEQNTCYSKNKVKG